MSEAGGGSPPGEIVVRLNGKSRGVPAHLSVRQLLETLSLRPELVVVELNGDILKREAYASVQVREGDTLEVVHFVGGGKTHSRSGEDGGGASGTREGITDEASGASVAWRAGSGR